MRLQEGDSQRRSRVPLGSSGDTSGVPRRGRDTSVLSAEGNTIIDVDNDCVLPEPPIQVLKTALDREKSFQVRQPDLYRGKNLAEWRTWCSQWETDVFRLRKWTYNTHSSRVFSAQTGLQDDPQRAWEAAIKRNACPIRWDAFKLYLANLISTAAIRKQQAFNTLRELKQGSKETVSELYSRMLDCENDVDPQPEENRIQTLDAALTDRGTLRKRPEISSWTTRILLHT